MIYRIPFYTAVIFLIVVFFIAAIPVNATPQQAQSFFQTPTPNPDGRIIYIIQAGDSCLSISLLTGINQNTLRQLNNLDEDCTLIEGNQLLLGTYTPPTEIPVSETTEEPLLPTPTPFSGNGTICIYLYEDVNGNARAEDDEMPIGGGEISITNRTGSISLTGTTTRDNQPLCFEEIPEDEYNISVAPPEGYNPTTAMNYPLKLFAGDLSTIDFGAQLSSQAQPVPVSEGGKSPWLAIIGGILILGGIGLGIYFRSLKY